MGNRTSSTERKEKGRHYRESEQKQKSEGWSGDGSKRVDYLFTRHNDPFNSRNSHLRKLKRDFYREIEGSKKGVDNGSKVYSVKSCSGTKQFFGVGLDTTVTHR